MTRMNFRRCRSAATSWTAMLPVFAFALIFSLSAGSTRGADVDLRAALERANQAMADQDYPAAVDAWQQALEADPDQPGLAYNLGVAAYKQGQLEEAKDRFTQALQNATPDVEARAKFNLGNVAYTQALEKMQAAPEAIQLLRSAVTHYRDALEVRPDDVDARANIESAWLLLDKLQQQQKKQNEQSKDQEKKNDSPQEKDKDESSDQKQDDQEKSAPRSQPSQDRNPRQDDQQEKSDDSKQESSPDQKESGPKKNDQQKPESSASDPNKSESREGTPQLLQAKPMTREEAERLLQSVRDRERARRLQVVERARGKTVPVKRDW